MKSRVRHVATQIRNDGPPSRPPQVLLAAWLLAGNVWLVCKAAAARALILP